MVNNIIDKESTGKIFLICNRLFYSVYFPIFFLILIFILRSLIMLSDIFWCIIYIFLILVWLFKLLFIPRNNSDKYGVIFVIDNAELYNENRILMFKKIKFLLQSDFKIAVFNNNFLRKIDKKEKTEKILQKKNYRMIINLFALEAKENSDNVYSLAQNCITVVTPTSEIDKETYNNLQKDFTGAFKKIIKLREKNSYKDINENANVISLAIRYFTSIIYILFGELEKAKKELMNMDFSDLPVDDKNIRYLRNGVVRRYIDIYFILSIRYLNKMAYLYDINELNDFYNIEKELEKYIDSTGGCSPWIRYSNNDIKSKIYFAQGEYSKSLRCLNDMQRKKPNDYSVLLSKAFVELNIGNFKSMTIYKKLARRRDINVNDIYACIEFINNSMKNKIHDINLLNLSKGILMYHWIDSEKGKNLILSSIDNIKIQNNELVKYIKVRYLK